tara:strand:+ start:90 stop:773 length:684 start_codon:yes stop_codon:yes gene_type:complete
MKKITTAIILMSVFSFTVNAQKSWDIDKRKGKLFFSVGSEYRITPIKSGERIYSLNSIATIEDVQNSGVAFRYAFDFFITNNISLGFSHSLRYDLISNSGEISTDGNFAYDKASYGLINGFDFYLDYHFKIFTEGELFVRLGKSLLNGGTDVSFRQSFFDANGAFLGSVFLTEDFSFYPWNFALGYKKNRTSFLIGIYSTSNTNYFDSNTSFIVPYFGFRYNLGKLF